jgi:hypothetical protein
VVKSAATKRMWALSIPSRRSRERLSRWVAGWSTSNHRTPGLAYRSARPSYPAAPITTDPMITNDCHAKT